MHDPLERLSHEAPVTPPSADSIRQRARRIQTRRRVAFGATGGGAVAAIVLIAAALGNDPVPRGDTAALRAGDTESQPAQFSTPDTAADGMGAGQAGAEGLDRSRARVTSPDESRQTEMFAAPVDDQPSPGAEALDVSLDDPPSFLTNGGAGSTAQFRVRACNNTEQAIKVEFPSSQHHDFEVTHENEVVWRWSADQAFLTAVTIKQWRPAQCHSWTSEWSASGRPSGTYRLVGFLTAYTPRETEPHAFCVGVQIDCLEEGARTG